MVSHLRAVIRLLWLGLLTLVFFLPVYVCWKRGYLRLRDRMVRRFWKTVCLILGVRVLSVGTMDKSRPLLIVSNHCSYCDVFVLGAHSPLRFTPKSDVENWPLIGLLCKMSGCIFIDRRRQRTAEQREKILAELSGGTAISLFPEGTTGDGIRMLPFRSSLFSLAEYDYEGKRLTVQPVTIAYRKLNGLPILSRFMPWVAWYGEMDFLAHFWHMMGTGGIEAALQFHPAVTVEPGVDRKALAARTHRTILDALPTLRSERNLTIGIEKKTPGEPGAIFNGG